MAERIFSKLASPALRKQKEQKEREEAEAAAAKDGGKRRLGMKKEPEVVKEAPTGLGMEESTGRQAGAGAGADGGKNAGLDVDEASGWTGEERLVRWFDRCFSCFGCVC